MSEDIDIPIRVQEFREKGFTILKKVHNAETINALVEKFYQLKEEEMGRPTGASNYLVSNSIEKIPKLFSPVVANPRVLDVAERIMGPFVQIGDSVMFGFEPIPKADAIGKVNGWHRDRYGFMPNGSYQSPLAIGALCYMQDMEEENGLFRAIPGSHCRPLTMEDAERSVPHKDETLVSVNAGDVVVFHSALVHSGSPNTSGKMRIFFGGSYIRTWMKPSDNHNGPSVQQLIMHARERNDQRMLRLFGVDDHMGARVNSGFLKADEVRWAEWAAADKAAIKSS